MIFGRQPWQLRRDAIIFVIALLCEAVAILAFIQHSYFAATVATVCVARNIDVMLKPWPNEDDDREP